MILPPEFLQALVARQDLSMHEARLVLFNFLYYKKGVQMPEVFEIPIVDLFKFERMITVACNYFT